MRKFLLPSIFAGILLLFSACDSKPQDPRAAIVIQTIPEGAEISISGKDCGKAPVKGRILPGSILIKAEMPGYDPVWRNVKLESGKQKEITLRLFPIKSAIMLKTTPAVPAEVSFNGKKYGPTPLVISGLPVGNYSASLKAPGYAPAQVEWIVNSKRPQMKIVKLFQNTGVIRVEAGPAKAIAKINGMTYRKLPCEVSLEQGNYSVTVSAPGYGSFTQNVSLKSGSREVVHPVLAELPGKLIISSSPSGAIVSVNGVKQGSTPLTVEGVKAGKVRLSFSLDKYDPLVVEQGVAPGQTLRISKTLVSSLGSIEFVTMPAGVTVYLDNRKMGVTERDPAHKGYSKVFRIGELQPGVHTLKFFHKFATPSEKVMNVEVVKNKNTRLEQNVELWIKNARIVHVVGTEYTGRIVSENDDYIKFEHKQGSRIDYKRSELKLIERLPERE